MKYIHGAEKYGKNIRLDFSANVNPFGMPTEVRQVLKRDENIDSFVDYPDFKCHDLRKAIGHKYGVEAENVYCGNGASDIIYRMCFSIKPSKVLLCAPCFSEYEKAVRAAGGGVVFYDTLEKNNFQIQSDFISGLDKHKPNMIFICSPSNPVGVLTDRRVLEQIAQWCEKNRCQFVIDECFNSFIPERRNFSMVQYAMENKYVHVLNAFTKIYGMAGIRLGFLISSNKEVLESCYDYGGCWNVSQTAQLAGIEALKCDEFVDNTVEFIKAERKRISKELMKFGLRVYDGVANYILFKADFRLYEYMLHEGVLIRQCGNYRGLGNEYYRIAVRSTEENNELMKLLNGALEDLKWQR